MGVEHGRQRLRLINEFEIFIDILCLLVEYFVESCLDHILRGDVDFESFPVAEVGLGVEEYSHVRGLKKG